MRRNIPDGFSPDDCPFPPDQFLLASRLVLEEATNDEVRRAVQRAEETGLDETEYSAEFYRDLVDGEPNDPAYVLDPVPPIVDTYKPDE